MFSSAEVWLTAVAIANMRLPNLAHDKRNINARALRENWPYRERETGRGGGREYPLTALPAAAQEAAHLILEKQRKKAEKIVEPILVDLRRTELQQKMDDMAAEQGREAGLARYAQLKGAPLYRADARSLVIVDIKAFASERGLSFTKAAQLYINAYNAGMIEKRPEMTTEKLSLRSVKRWKKIYHYGGPAALAGAYGNRVGTTIIETTPEIENLVLSIIHDKPHTSASVIYKALKARLTVEKLPSVQTLRRYIAEWKKENKQLHAFITNPDAWRSKYQAAAGDADAGVVRLNQRWEMDTTPGDVLLSDGRYVAIGVIDVFSRRLKLHVSRTSSSLGVSALIRKAIKAWGVPETIGTDQGSDYTSKHIAQSLTSLGIEQKIAPPFSPDRKPFIERAFGTFSRDILELCDGYIGHSVAERKEIEARRSFADRLMKKGQSLDMSRMTPAEFQSFCDRWCDDLYAHAPHGGLNGKTPFTVASTWPGELRKVQDERALDILLAPMPDGDGHRYIGKKGLRIDGAYFEATEFGGREGDRVQVKIDEGDIGTVYVFDEKGAFICRAFCTERMGIDLKALSAARKTQQKQRLIEARRELKRKHVKTTDLVHNILDKAREDNSTVLAFPQPAEVHSTPAISAATTAAQEAAGEPLFKKEILPEAAKVEWLKPIPKPKDPIAEENERFEQALRIDAQGTAASETDRRWLAAYKNTPAYRSRMRAREHEREFNAALTGA